MEENDSPTELPMFCLAETEVTVTPSSLFTMVSADPIRATEQGGQEEIETPAVSLQ